MVEIGRSDGRQNMTVSISRVHDQNGVSLIYILLEIHHSGLECLIWSLLAVVIITIMKMMMIITEHREKLMTLELFLSTTNNTAVCVQERDEKQVQNTLCACISFFSFFFVF